MKNLIASIILTIVFVLPFQVLADSDHDPSNNSGNSTNVFNSSNLVHFTLDDEKYIDDIPFNTELVSTQMYFGNSYLNPMENNFQLNDETYVNDIPFDTERVYWECRFNQNCGAVDFASVSMDEESYIDDIPFNTQKMFAMSIPTYGMAETQLKEFKIEEEEYIDDIPFNTEDYVADSIGYENKEESYSITSFVLDEEEYIDDIPWDTQQLFAELMLYPNYLGNQREEGMVLVSFHYNEDGYIEVDMVNGSSEELKNHVVETLEDVRLTRGIVSIGKEYNARFDFKLK